MMGAGEAVQRAVVAALADGGAVVFDGAPGRAPFPYLTVGDVGSTDWSHQGADGREVRVAVTAWDEAGAAARLHGAMAAAEAAVTGIAGSIDGGWQVASVALIRTRMVRDPVRPWAGMVDVRFRVARLD